MPGVVDKQNFMAMNLRNEEVVKKPGECARPAFPQWFPQWPTLTASRAPCASERHRIGGQQFIVDNLKSCKLRVFDHCQQVTIDDCEDCDIVLGPCEDSVFVRDCSNCTVHVVAQQLRVRGCVDCTFFLWVPTDPVIESSHGLRIGQWHVAYPGLTAHMAHAKLNPEDVNKWSQVYDFTPDDAGGEVHWRRVATHPQVAMQIAGVDAPCDSPLRRMPSTSNPASPAAVKAKVVESGAPAAAAAKTTEQQAGPRFFRVVYNGVVTVRDGPNREAKEVGERMKGDVIEAAEVSDGWIRLQPPPGFTGGERWVCTKVGTTLLLDELSSSEIPKQTPPPVARARASTNQQSGCPCGVAGGLFFGLLALALTLLCIQHFVDGSLRKLYPEPQFSLADIPDQAGKYALITGATSGIGKAIATELARRGAHVLVGARDEARAQDAVADIIGETGASPALVEPLIIDLGSLASVKAAADLVNAKESPLHTLVLNAGVMWAPYSLTTDGYETQFAVNHLGHFALVTNLLSKLKSAPGGARVVTVSSNAHQYGYSGGVRGLFTEHFRDAINDENEYSAAAAYGQSKLCNILMSSELSRRLEGTNVYSNVAHPGFVATSLMRHIPSTLAAIAELIAMGPTDGALTPLFLATSPKVETENIRGKYYIPIAHLGAVDEDLDDPAIAKKLWSQSEKLVDAVLEDPDPDRYFVGKKSTKDDGRRSRIVPKAPSGGASTGGDSTDGLCTEESKDHCGGDTAGSTTTKGSTGPKSVVVSGPGGAKWEIFQNEDGSWPPEANMPPDSPPPPPPPKKSAYVKPESKIIMGPGGAKWEIFKNEDGSWPETAHP